MLSVRLLQQYLDKQQLPTLLIYFIKTNAYKLINNLQNDVYIKIAQFV